MATTPLQPGTAPANAPAHPTAEIIAFPPPPRRWKYPLPDMTDPRNRAAWESLLDFGHHELAQEGR